MHIVYLDKQIILENIISDINIINIDESIEYLRRNDGVLIKGAINLDCEYLSLGVIKSFNDKVDVSMLIPYENIQTNELEFKLLDFDYLFHENKLSLSFKVNINGYKEVEKSFQDEVEEMEIVSNIDVPIDKIKELINTDDEIIEIENSKLIEDELNVNPINLPVINIEEIDDDKAEEGRQLEFNISGDKEENKVEFDNNKKMSLFDSIFKKDKKIKMWKYRVILENDNYEDIAKEYNVNLYKLKELNKNVILETGKIIKIPNYHE